MPRKAKKCPVGLVCFRIKVRHIALLILLLAVFFIFLVCNKKKHIQSVSHNRGLRSNFDNLNTRGNRVSRQKKSNSLNQRISAVANLLNNNKPQKPLSRNSFATNTNSQSDVDVEVDVDVDMEEEHIPETTNITINYQMPTDTSESTYLVNKDYERVINPLEPPERRNFYMQSSGLERVVATPGVPINVPTRGYSGGVMQVGILHKEEVSDDSKRVGQNTEPVILPLFGRQTYNGSNKWSYYTSTDKMNQVKIPISNKNRVCNSEYGCDELYDGDTVSVPAYNGDFKVSIYEFDKPRYIPYL